MPVVSYLNENGIDTELWLENQAGHEATVAGLSVPSQLIESDLHLNPIVLARRLNRYRRRLAKSCPRVLHAHQTRAALVPLLAAYREGVPIRVYNNHGLPYMGYVGPKRVLLRVLERINIGLATHILLVSHSNLAYARADGLLNGNQGAVLGSGSAVGIDLHEFTPEQFGSGAARQARLALDINPAVFVLVFVGRPVRRKGFHLLLDVWRRSELGRQGGVLLLAGCSHQDCLRALGGSVPGVRGLGYMTDLKPFYAASDAVVLPSAHEGFPYALLEGAAAGRPLIGSDIPGIRCAIVSGETGILVPPNDPIALGGAIEQLAADPPLRRRLGANARRRVEREFSRERVLRNLLAYYRDELLDACALQHQAN